MALQICKESIDTYCNITTQTNLKKSVMIRGHLGARKTFCILYIALYNNKKGCIQLEQKGCAIVNFK